MKTFFEWYESQSFRRYIAFHGTKFPQIIEKFDVPTSFAAKVEMALRYVKQGRYYNENNFGRIYKVEITTAKPYVVSTQERMREMISKIVTDKKFKKEILSEGYDTLMYGIPNLDSDSIITPIKSPDQIKIIDMFQLNGEKEHDKGYMLWGTT